MSLQENSDSARFVQAILDNTLAVIYAKDKEGRYQFINHRFEELFGIALDEIRGRTDFDIFPMELAERFHINDQRTLRTQAAIEFEEVAPHDDGPHTYISLKFPYRDECGECIGTCGISTDITPRKEIEAALQRSEERFRQLAENVPECFWITDTNTWQVLYVSPAFERIWQRSCTEIYDNPEAWIESIHPDDRQRVANAFVEKVKVGLFQEVYRIVQPDGNIRWIADRGFPVRNAQGEVYRVAGVAEDITERRQLEQQVTEISSHERQRISRELHDSLGQQLTGLGYMAKSLTNHLAESSRGDQEMAQDILDGLQDAVAEVRRIVRGLAPVDVDTFGLKAALQDLANATGKYSDVQCEFVCPQTVEVADNAVATQLFRIAQESINNAVKHSGASRITINLESNHDCLRMQIRDDGRGYNSAESNFGMGLRIMKYRSNLIGATFDIRTSGHGTTVVCTLKQEIQRG
jgi:PAS domain S-box-containing protein